MAFSLFLDEFKCCLSKKGHFIVEPVLLSCGYNACKNCLNENIGTSNEKLNEVKCYRCDKKHTVTELNLYQENYELDKKIKQYFSYLNGKLKDNKHDIKNLNADMKQTFDNIEHSIKSKVHSLIQQLNEYANEHILELNKIRETHLREYTEIREAIHKERKELTSDFISFKAKQDLLDRIENFTKTRNAMIEQLNFVPETKTLNKSILGYLVDRWTTVKSQYTVQVKSIYNLKRLLYLEKFHRIIINSQASRMLCVLDLRDKSVKTIKHEKLQSPDIMCVGDKDTIYVADKHSNSLELHIFDASLMLYKNSFTIKNTIALKMMIDLIDSKHMLYIINNNFDRIEVYDAAINNVDKPNAAIKYVEFEKAINIVNPIDMQYNEDFLIVLHRHRNGKYSMVLFDKTDYKEVNKLAFDNFLNPIGFYLNNFDQIVMLASEKSEENTEQQKLESQQYLYMIDLNGNILHKIKNEPALRRITEKDIIIYDKTIVQCDNSHLSFIVYA